MLHELRRKASSRWFVPKVTMHPAEVTHEPQSLEQSLPISLLPKAYWSLINPYSRRRPTWTRRGRVEGGLLGTEQKACGSRATVISHRFPVPFARRARLAGETPCAAAQFPGGSQGVVGARRDWPEGLQSGKSDLL